MEGISLDGNKVEAAELEAKALQLIDRCGSCLVGSVTPDGYPNMKAMLKMEHDGLKTFWFSTNTPSMRVSHFRVNPKASVYFVDFPAFTGLMLEGEMEILEDQDSKDRLWREGFERYYSKGKTDPGYCVLKFTAHSARHYPLFQQVEL